MKRLYLGLLLVLFVWNIHAQTPLDYQLKARNIPVLETTESFIPEGPSSSFRSIVPQELADTLQSILENRWEWLGSVGLSAALRLPNGEIWSGAAGISANDSTGLMTPEHRLCMGSITKTIVAATILDLYEEGLLSLDDSLYKWNIQFQHIDTNITVRQLLRHQSGVFNFTSHPNFSITTSLQPYVNYSHEEVLTDFINEPLFPAGSSFSYSNSNYTLLAIIIETITGNPFHEEIRNRFIDPLGLENTFLPFAEPWQSPVAHLWLDINGNGNLIDYHDNFILWETLLTSVAAPGGFFTTPADLTEWIYQSQSGAIFEEATMQEIHSFLPTSQFPGNSAYGLGVMRRKYDGEWAYGHGGDLSYASSAWYFPDKDISVAMQDNDGTIISWDHSPIVADLLRAYKWYESTQTVAIDELEKEKAINIYPNPVSEILTIQNIGLNLADRVEVINANGQIIEVLNRENKMEINVKDWTDGMYWVRSVWEDGVEVLPVIKQ